MDKNVFMMYAIKMMINVARGYNAIGYYKTAMANELDIKYIYDTLHKEHRVFSSQEFQFNVVYGETLQRQGQFKEAYEMLSKAINDKAHMSSEMDLFCVCIYRAEALIEFEWYVDAQTDIKAALKLAEKGRLSKSKRCEMLKIKCENPPLPKEFLR